MSILIKNIEMPKCCDKCWALDDYGDYPVCRITEEQRGYDFPIREKRMDKCPLVPVPPSVYVRPVKRGKLMYDELIKRLRHTAQLADKGLVIPPSVCIKAADVIEELNKYADTIMQLKSEGWYLQRTKYRDGYTAIETMPLPESPKEEEE